MLRPAPRDVRVSRATYVAALVAFAAWLPFLRTPLASDASGFLTVGRQWDHGSSLYGDHWVDRPPLLIWIFRAAARLGPVGLGDDGVSAPAVMVLGGVASAVVVLLAGLLAAQLASPGTRWTTRAVPVLAAALLSSPLLGMPETNGELLAAPFVMLGVVALVAALSMPAGRRPLLLAAGAGAAGMAAALVKQNVVDVFGFALVLMFLCRGRVTGLGRLAGSFAAGAVVVLAATLASAAERGTSPADLWRAVVVFRIRAGEVIDTAASANTSHRMLLLTLAFLASGAALTLGTVAFLNARDAIRDRPRGAPLAVAGLALAGWELVGVVAGGSYWLHYLTGLVPGIVVLACLVGPTARVRRMLTVCLGLALVATGAAWTEQLINPANPAIALDAKIAHYLRDHAAPGDGVVIAFGRPDIVVGSGLSSPYEHLWSLPVRVLDPELTELRAVLTGPDAPRWVVVSGASLATWGVDASGVQDYFVEHYREQAAYDDFHIWQRR
ncbi:hypothetical protein RB608_16295 [Nocardioides sp. LHD-245]|uniref:hypothetical protein n=1 Tax=Nocardioides sp. LHD-245 TaxID=3051387 RepID=UPI0027DF4F69|nr:hypothetical protein [Nocardioides sp. LHD-245]